MNVASHVLHSHQPGLQITLPARLFDLPDLCGGEEAQWASDQLTDRPVSLAARPCVAHMCASCAEQR